MTPEQQLPGSSTSNDTPQAPSPQPAPSPNTPAGPLPDVSPAGPSQPQASPAVVDSTALSPDSISVRTPDLAGTPPAQPPTEPGVYAPESAPGPAESGTASPVVFSNPQPPKRGEKKIWITSAAAAVLLLLIGWAVFGWYLPNTPTNAYSLGMDRTGKALDDLVNTATSKNMLASYKTTAITGTASATFGSDSFSGTFHSTFDKVSSDNGLDVILKDSGSQTEKLSLKALTQIPAGKLYPDIYFQFSGLRSLGLDQAFPQLEQYDGKWIVVSSDYLKTIGDSYLQTSDNTSKNITADDVTGFVKVTEGVTRDYVFTAKPDKAVLTKKSFVGKENVDGVNTYHYKMALNAANAKAYCQALNKAVNGTSLYKKLTAGDASAAGNQKNTAKDCADAVNQAVKDYPSFDMWIDGHYKLVDKVRLYDPDNKQAYTDIGQNYRGGGKLAFFTDYVDNRDNMTGSLTFNTDTSTRASDMALNIKDTSKDDPYTVSVKLQARAQSDPVKITKPANPVPVQDVLNALGLASDPAAIAAQSADSGVQINIDALDSQLEAAYADNGYYPTLAQLNSAGWRTANMPDLDKTTLAPPDSKATTLAAAATKDQFGYAPAKCDASGCQGFTLSGLLSDGSLFTKRDLGSGDTTDAFTD